MIVTEQTGCPGTNPRCRTHQRRHPVSVMADYHRRVRWISLHDILADERQDIVQPVTADQGVVVNAKLHRTPLNVADLDPISRDRCDLTDEGESIPTGYDPQVDRHPE